MVAEQYVSVDVEKAVRAWTRGIGLNAHFGVPRSPTFPLLVLRKVRGTSDDALIQWDVYGATKEQAAQTAGTLSSALSALASYDTAGVRLHGADVLNDGQWLPDPATDRPRYVVEANVTATAI